MKIICDITFLDGTDRFEKDDQRTVDDTRGAYFIANGWAHEVGGTTAELFSGEVNLDVHNAVNGLKDNHG